MSLRQIIYRHLYLQTPGWKITRWLRKDKKCGKCSSKGTDLHHLDYPFFAIWYPMFFLTLGIWYFWDGGLWLFVALIITPDPISPLKTLCRRCHELEERRKWKNT